MSETKKKKYVMPQIHYIVDGKEIKHKPIYDKEGKVVQEPIIIKGPEELEKEGGYMVIQAEPTKGNTEREI